MKNKLVDLNNHLFAQLERLGDETLDKDAIKREIKRTDAIVNISEQIISNAQISLAAAKLIADQGGKWEGALPAIEGKPTAKEVMDFTK